MKKPPQPTQKRDRKENIKLQLKNWTLKQISKGKPETVSSELLNYLCTFYEEYTTKKLNIYILIQL